jgi:ribosomal protein L11 methyltransferase
MKNLIQISIPITDLSISEQLIAELDALGYNGFEEQENSLQAWAEEADFLENDLVILLNKYNLSYSKSVIEDQNWNAVWESAFTPVIVEDFVGIRASFHAPLPGVRYELLITPKMSFGTGHHATTWQMILLMGELDLSGKRVLDFGTGTGVLAILAEKLGAAGVLAVDNDQWSVNNASENIINNNCKIIEIQLVDNISNMQMYDCLLANINRHILLANFDDMAAAVKPGGHVLLSGILEADIPDIRTEADNHGWMHQKTITRSGWAAQLYQV